MKSVSSQYYSMFGEMPYLLTTQSYENEDYQMLMNNAILMNKKLKKEDVINFFGKDYDYVELED